MSNPKAIQNLEPVKVKVTVQNSHEASGDVDVKHKHTFQVILDHHETSESNFSLTLRNPYEDGTLPETLDEEDETTPLTEVEPEISRTLWSRLKGIVSILIATVLIAMQSQILYYLKEVRNIPYSCSVYLMWAYMIYSFENIIPVLSSVYVDYARVYRPFKNKKILYLIYALRGILGSMIMYVNWHAINYFKRPAPVSVITAMAPIFVYINAFFVLKEKLGVVPFINAFVAIGGVAIMNLDELGNPHEKSNGLVGTALALVSMYLLSWCTVIVRLLKDVNPFLVSLSFGVCGIVLQFFISVGTHSLRTIDDHITLLFCFLTASISTVSNYFFNLSLRYEQAGVVSLVRTTEVLFSFLYQYLIFGLEPKGATAIGATLILMGVVCVTLRKIVQDSREDSSMRKYLFFLLY